MAEKSQPSRPRIQRSALPRGAPPSNPAEARKERKRLNDRRAQQSSRARTKAYIQQLENQVKVATEDPRSSLALSSVQQQQAENAKLRATITKIEELLTEVRGDVVHKEGQEPSKGDLTLNSVQSPGSDKPPNSSPCSNTISCEESSFTKDTTSSEGLPDLFSGTNFFQAVNDLLVWTEEQAKRFPADVVYENDEDITIRAVLDGWDAVKARHRLDIGWQALEVVDQGIFNKTGVVERVATLRIMRSVFLVLPTILEVYNV